MKLSSIRSAAACLMVMVVLILGADQLQPAAGATCVITQLSPCIPAITSSSPPSKLCCARIKQQRPCLCRYARDPNYGQYVNTPKAKGIARSCRVPIPKC